MFEANAKLPTGILIKRVWTWSLLSAVVINFAGRRLQVAGCRSQVAGYRSQVAGRFIKFDVVLKYTRVTLNCEIIISVIR